jgi:hypothetical protein
VAFVFLACSMDYEGGNSETSAGLLAGEKADVEQDATSFFVTDDNDGRGQVFGHTPRWAFTRTSDGDLERLRELAETGPRSDSPSGHSPVADAIATLRGLDPSQEISVTFELSENGIPPLRPLPPGASAREAAIAGRARSLAPIQDALVARARARGGSEVGRSWLANLVTLRLSSVAAASLAESADVLGVSFDAVPTPLADQDLCSAPLGGNTIGIDGASYRTGNREANLPTAYNGDSGGRAGARTRVAVIEAGGDFPVRNHYAFRFSSPADRIVVSKSCNSASCTTSTPAGVTSHGNAVAQWAAGSVEPGQDPNCTSQSRLTRSGSGSYGSQLLYYAAPSCEAERRALEDAVGNGADIVNFSLSNDNATQCNRSFDCGGLNAAIRNATNAGTLIVAAAGNDGNAPGCNSQCCLAHPARRPEVLTVGGLNTLNRTTDYNSYSHDSNSAAGGVLMDMNDGYNGTDSGVDLLGPYSVNFTGANAPGWYANSGATIASGTSFAAPAIAGAAASVLDGFRSIGWYQDARTLRLNLLLMGDAGSFWGDSLSGIGTSWGAGRMHAAVPYSGWETAPYWWGQSPFALQPGVTAWGCINGCNPMPSSVRQYNWVLYFEDADFVAVPRITIEVINADTGAVIRGDYSSSMTKRVQLRDSEIWGRRLQLRVTPVSMASTTTVYSGDFYHSSPNGWTYH